MADSPEGREKTCRVAGRCDRSGRVDELADKSTAGSLSAEERAEYESYIAASTLIGILQSGAKNQTVCMTFARNRSDVM